MAAQKPGRGYLSNSDHKAVSRRVSLWRLDRLGESLRSLNIGRVIDQLEEDQELADNLEHINQENEQLNSFNEIKREAEALCMLEVRSHLFDFLDSHPSSTYEEWIKKLHPENVNQKHPHLIDHRFYVEDSDHRRLWNINLTRGGGKRSYMHAKTGDDLPVRWVDSPKRKGERMFHRREGNSLRPDDLHHANLIVDMSLHEEEHELLDVDVSNPMGNLDMSVLEPEVEHKGNNDAANDDDNSISSYPPPDPLYKERQQSAAELSINSSGHLSLRSFSSKEKENDSNKRRTSHKYLHDSVNHPHIYHPDPYEDLGFDHDDEDYDKPMIYPPSFPPPPESSLPERSLSTPQLPQATSPLLPSKKKKITASTTHV